MPNDMSTEDYEKCDDYLKNIDFLKQLQKPDEFQQKLQTLKEKAPYVLAEFKTAYVLYNKNPEYPDYQQIFASTQSNVDNISSQMFTLLNDVQYNVNNLNKKMLCLNAKIEEEKNKNKILKKNNGLVDEQNNAASELIYDYKNIYEEGYLRNWGLIISIIIVGFAVKNMYGNINGDMNTSIGNSLQNIKSNAKNIGDNVYNNAKNIGDNVYNNAKNIRDNFARKYR